LLARAWRRCAVLFAVVLLAACAPPPVQRPREGAPPIAGGTPIRLEPAVPATLSAYVLPTSTSTPEPPGSPSPGVASSPGPAGSPGLAPIISGLQPAPGASLPAGDVVISARISGSTDLVDVTAFVDGEAVELEPVGPSVRVKTISFVRTFTGGSHEVRIQARDDRNQLGGYRWQFAVGAGRQPAAAPTAAKPAPPTSAVQTRTPIALPTRRPTVALPAPAPAKPSPPPR
jgi:hypothetical protein